VVVVVVVGGGRGGAGAAIRCMYVCTSMYDITHVYSEYQPKLSLC
jgi:succinate dehydrogenase/fumarate reductase flavoprotein subunit